MAHLGLVPLALVLVLALLLLALLLMVVAPRNSFEVDTVRSKVWQHWAVRWSTPQHLRFLCQCVCRFVSSASVWSSDEAFIAPQR